MYKYAQINSQKVVTGISYLSDIVKDKNMILLKEESEVQIGSIHDGSTGDFTAPVVPEPTPTVPQLTLEEMQAQTLLNTEYLVSKSELLGGM